VINELYKAKQFKEKLRSGQCCLGAQIALTNPVVVEIFARTGFDWMVVDTEHSAHDIENVRWMLQTAATTPAVLLARPLRLDADEIRRILDIGSPGVLCPFINNGAEATSSWCTKSRTATISNNSCET
jgi:4-hydroxy-2-oxoheptanedioate aldolase